LNHFEGGIGITGSFPHERRCGRCDYPLTHSKHEGVNLVYSRNTTNTNLLCVQCATKSKRITINDLDNYISRQITKLISPKMKEKKRGSLEYENYIS